MEPEAAVAIVCARGESGSVLLIRRAERANDSWSGHWSFPGGRRDPGDSSPIDTALRELEEECGIRLAAGQVEAALPPMVARRAAGPFLLVAPFVFRVEGELPTVLDSREAAEARWVPLRILADPARHRLLPMPGLPPEMRFPAIELPGPPLWGFTYRLITEWLGLVDAKPVPDFAQRVLDFLLSQGLTLERGWSGTPPRAAVTGAIPTAAVLELISAPGHRFPEVNLIEVTPESIRIVGLAFEEYLIQARPGRNYTGG